MGSEGTQTELLDEVTIQHVSSNNVGTGCTMILPFKERAIVGSIVGTYIFFEYLNIDQLID